MVVVLGWVGWCRVVGQPITLLQPNSRLSWAVSIHFCFQMIADVVSFYKVLYIDTVSTCKGFHYYIWIIFSVILDKMSLYIKEHLCHCLSLFCDLFHSMFSYAKGMTFWCLVKPLLTIFFIKNNQIILSTWYLHSSLSNITSNPVNRLTEKT